MTGSDEGGNGAYRGSAPLSVISLHCHRCGHVWLPRGETAPKHCPKCHSRRWAETDMDEEGCADCDSTLTGDDARRSERGRPVWKEIEVFSFQCNRCGYAWVSRFPSPKRCPYCKTTQWGLLLTERTCRRCGHLWRTRSAYPRLCPACRSSMWDQAIWTVRCSRCGHKWRPAGEAMPKKCPNCKSKRWNEPVQVRNGCNGPPGVADAGRGGERAGKNRGR